MRGGVSFFFYYFAKNAIYTILSVLLKTFLEKVAEKLVFLRIYIYVSGPKLRNGGPFSRQKDSRYTELEVRQYVIAVY